MCIGDVERAGDTRIGLTNVGAEDVDDGQRLVGMETEGVKGYEICLGKTECKNDKSMESVRIE